MTPCCSVKVTYLLLSPKRLIGLKSLDDDHQLSGYISSRDMCWLCPLRLCPTPSGPPNAVMARCKVHCKKIL
jgi:hypothetical protein